MLVRNKFNNPGRGSDAKMNRLNPTSPIESSNKSVNSYLADKPLLKPAYDVQSDQVLN